MTKEFIPYEEALAMKELGFDEECIAHFNNNHKLQINVSVLYKNNELLEWEAAPLYQQAFRWFREKYKWHGEPAPNVDNNWGVFTCNLNTKADYYSVSIQRTYEEAQLASLKELIKIVQDGKADT